MREITSTVTINRAAHKVFDFTLNPDNTPKYVASIVKEQANETPAKLGTIYKNQREDGSWSEYVITALEPNALFVLSKKDGNLRVTYAFTPLGHYQCELKYYIGGDIGDLDAAFIEQVLQKLKAAIENEQ